MYLGLNCVTDVIVVVADVKIVVVVAAAVVVVVGLDYFGCWFPQVYHLKLYQEYCLCLAFWQAN